MKLGLILMLALASPLALGCGDDGDGGGDSAGGGSGSGSGSGGDGDGTALDVDTGLPPAQTATDTSVEDAQDLCEAFEATRTREEDIRIDCTSTAAQEEEDEASCIERRDGCIEFESDSDPSDDSCDGEEIQRGLETCSDDVTIGEIEDCLNEVFGWEATLTCADAGNATMPSCLETLIEDCPMLFDGPDDNRDDGGDGDGDGGGNGGSAGSGGDGDGDEPDLNACVEGDAASQDDCATFCGPLGNAGCDNGVDEVECNQICGLMLEECPGVVGELVACQAAQEPSWTCDEDGDPDLTSCQFELVCFGACLDTVVDR